MGSSTINKYFSSITVRFKQNNKSYSIGSEGFNINDYKTIDKSISTNKGFHN